MENLKFNFKELKIWFFKKLKLLKTWFYNKLRKFKNLKNSQVFKKLDTLKI